MIERRTFLGRINSMIFLLLVFFSNLGHWQLFDGLSGFNIFMGLFFLFVIINILFCQETFSILSSSYVLIPVVLFFSWWLLRALFAYRTVLFFNDDLWKWILIFILFTNYLSKDIRIGYKALLMFLLSVVAIFLIYQFADSPVYENGRLTVFTETNPNQIGSMASKSLIIAIFFIAKDVLGLGRLRYLLILTVPGLFIVLIQSGSRGALLYFIIGALLYFIVSWKGIRRKLLAGLTILLSFGIAAYFFFNSEIFTLRWIVSDWVDLSGRRQIWETSLDLILSKPIMGYGDGAIGSIIYNDPHNLYFVVLLSSGLVGLALFLFFLSRILKITYSNIKLNQNSICFLLLIVTLIGFFKEGGAIDNLSTWITLSIISGLSLADIATNNNEIIEFKENEIISY